MSRRKPNPRSGNYKAPCLRSGIKLRYRVCLRKVAAAAEVIWLTNQLSYATEIAEFLNSEAGRSVAWVEQFNHSAHPLRWHPVCSKENPELNGPSRVTERPKALRSGDVVQAELLSERTRRGGWKARLVDSGFIGPITNSDSVPAAAKPNTIVTLTIGAANRDGTHLQLVWQG